MLYIFINILLLSNFVHLGFCYGSITHLNVLGYALDEHYDLYKEMLDDFNNYSKKNNLNITIDSNIYSNPDSIPSINDYESLIESALLRQSTNYDIIYYDNGFSSKYGEYLLDLKKYLPEEHIELFNPNLLSYTCKYGEKLVGMPYSIGYSVLYSNTVLLERYNKTIPKTWDELIETSKYIIEKENDPDLVAYNGLFNDSEQGLCSIYEFIYSCRESYDSPFPEINSETSIKALNLIKKLKNEISSVEKTLDQLELLTKVHYISITSIDSAGIIGLLFFEFITLLIVFMLSSLAALYLKRFKLYFKYLSNDFWIITILGLVLILSSCYTFFGPLTKFKCNFHLTLVIVGFTLNLAPILHKFIASCPEKNKMLKWISHHKYIFLMFYLFIDIFICISFYNNNNLETIIINEKPIFKKCALNNGYNTSVMVFILAFFFVHILIMILFSFIEWRQRLIIYDVQLYVYTFYAICILMLVIISYISFYGYRLTIPYNKEKVKEIAIYINKIKNSKKLQNNNQHSSNTSINSISSNKPLSRTRSTYTGNGPSRNLPIYSRMLYYHKVDCEKILNTYTSGLSNISIENVSKNNISMENVSKNNISMESLSKNRPENNISMENVSKNQHENNISMENVSKNQPENNISIENVSKNQPENNISIENATLGNNTQLNVIAYAIDPTFQPYTPMVNDFNEYSKRNNLNITLNLNIYTNLNLTTNINDYAMVKTLLTKKKKFDLFFYDNAFTPKYGEYLLDLKEYLPKEHITLFDSKLISSSCLYDDKIIGLPYSVGYSMLYSNKLLLNKYNQTVPKTWDELIEISQFILEKENDPDLIAYNGLFDDSDQGICSIYEFIYSCRDSYDSPFPEINSETSIKALKLIKKIKNTISSAEEVLTQVDDLTKFHFISFNSDDSIGILAKIIYITSIVISIFMFLSLLFLYTEKFKIFFQYLSIDSWIITIIGLIIIICSCFTSFGPITVIKYIIFSILYSININVENIILNDQPNFKKFFVISSYTSLYGFRLLIPFNKKKEKEITLYINTIFNLRNGEYFDTFSSNITEKTENDDNTFKKTDYSVYSQKRTMQSILYSKILSYHNTETLSKSFSFNCSESNNSYSIRPKTNTTNENN
ncbi:periplasmic binding protein-like II [Anaeromyces robustus]|uniref:Periplasmic binding protein-like II n=1 Tax=Anaeromyces robustus TaxID=1754192 RepID=A0A1Y1X0B4_9FUNG|nr:periplasmic binding protein-like II [Anaeromyces robustus]|eukprot:ORX79048.1 periplasmic binding protein-like II [Anaeromyces robustus]